MAVVIVGTLDTKAEEIGFARDVLAAQDVDVHVVDVGVLGKPGFDPDTAASDVAGAADQTLTALRKRADRGESVETMGDGAAIIARELYESGGLDGVLGIGGSSNTSIATSAMRALPVGVPKVMVSTMAAGDTEPYVGASDIAMMSSVTDVEGLNPILREVVTNAALAMAGMVSNESDSEIPDKPTIGLTMFGVTTPCVQAARKQLEARGYGTVVFHATGTGGRAMEALIEEGRIDGVLDVTTTELADELVGGELSAGPSRLETAGAAGIPQVVSTGAVDMVNFGPRDSVPSQFDDRELHVHNPEVTLMRTTAAENTELGKLIAEKLASAAGPTAVALPLDGVSKLDRPGEAFHDPEADEALFDSLRDNLGDDVDVLEISAGINEPAFATALVDKLDEFMRRVGAAP